MGIKFKSFKKKVKMFFWILKNKKTPIDMEFKQKNILIIDCWIPEYDKDSGSRRMSKIIQALIESNYKVFLVSDQHEYKYNDTYVPFFEKQGVTVYRPYLEGITPVNLKLFLTKILSNTNDVILSRPDVFDKYFSSIKKIKPRVNIIYDMVDFHYLRNLREYQLNNSKHALRESEKYKILEKKNCALADITYVVSNGDEKLLRENRISCKQTRIVSNIHDSKDINKDFVPYEKRSDLLFIGGFDHTPNIDAVKFLRNEILPLIWKEDPSIKMHIIGSNAPKEIKDLHTDRFIIHGYVENLDTLFNSCRVFVAPLRFGAGIKGKIGQSLEYNLPLVTTNIGSEGFDFSTTEDLMVGRTAREIANKVIKIYNNSTNWNMVSRNSINILRPFSFDHMKSTVLSSLTENLN